MTATKAKGVRTEHPLRIKMLPLWQRCEDAAEGEHAIHAAGERYLPKLAEEESADYAKRLKRTPFFNATWRTISGLKGMMFRKAPTLDAPDNIKTMLEDVDMADTPLDVFAQDVSEDVLKYGFVGLLADRPPMPVNGDGSSITVAQAEAMGLRATIQSYSAPHIINWRQARINNVMMTTLAVLKEQADVAGADEFAQASEDRYRVLDLIPSEGAYVYRQRVFRINDKDEDEQVGEDIFPMMNGKRMGEIPFVFITTDDIGPNLESPPLLDLVDMNLHHYTVSADYEHGCHFSGLPTPVISGYTPSQEGEKLYIGGAAIITLADPQATAAYMEVQGDFGALKSNLDGKKSEMAVLGARMLEVSKDAVESAETQQQRTVGEQSQLGAMAQIISMGITKALQLFTAWSGSTATVSYEINRDFLPARMTAQELTALVTSWQAGAFSNQVLFENLKRGEVVQQSTTYEEEQERIASSTPPTPPPAQE